MGKDRATWTVFTGSDARWLFLSFSNWPRSFAPNGISPPLAYVFVLNLFKGLKQSWIWTLLLLNSCSYYETVREDQAACWIFLQFGKKINWRWNLHDINTKLIDSTLLGMILSWSTAWRVDISRRRQSLNLGSYHHLPKLLITITNLFRITSNSLEKNSLTMSCYDVGIETEKYAYMVHQSLTPDMLGSVNRSHTKRPL